MIAHLSLDPDDSEIRHDALEALNRLISLQDGECANAIFKRLLSTLRLRPRQEQFTFVNSLDTRDTWGARFSRAMAFSCLFDHANVSGQAVHTP